MSAPMQYVLVQQDPDDNRDDSGQPLDLYGYLLNEFEAHRIKVGLAEVSEAYNVIAAERDKLREALEGLFEHCSMIHSRWGENGNAHEANVAIARARAALAKSRNDVEDNAVRREWDAARYVESEDAAERNCRHDWVENEESGRTYCLTCGQDGDA